MKYYKLLYDYENDKKAVCCRCDELFGMDKYLTEKGLFIQEWRNDITFFYDTDNNLELTDYLGNNLGWFIVSLKLKTILEELEGCIQFLPIKLVNREKGKEIQNYYVANIYSLIEALDLENSKYSEFNLREEKILSIKLYALKRTKIENKHIFKLKESYMPKFVSEQVKLTMEQYGITGCDFLQVKVV